MPIDTVDTNEEFSELLFMNIEKQINKKNIYINTAEDWFEISKNIIDEEELYTVDKQKVEELFKDKYIKFIKNKFEINIKKYWDKLEESQLSLQDLYDNIMQDNLEKLLVKEKYILKDELNINNTKENLDKTLKHYSLKNNNQDEFTYVKIIAKKVVKNSKNIKGFNISNKGAINRFINNRTKEVIPDFYTINDFNENTWNKKEVFVAENIINDEELNFDKYEVDKYLDESIGELNFYNNTNNIKSMELNLEDMSTSLPTNNMLVFSMVDLIDNDMLFSITKYLEDTSKIDNFYINEVGDIKVVFNEKIMGKTLPLKNIKQFIYLDNFFEKPLMEGKDGILFVSCNSKNYNSLYEINELQDINENKISDSLILMPKNSMEKDILRIKYYQKENNIEELKKIEENFHIIKKEKILIDKNIVSDFSSLEDLSPKNLNKYYKEIMNNIPKEILLNVEKLNEGMRKKLENKLNVNLKNNKDKTLENNDTLKI